MAEHEDTIDPNLSANPGHESYVHSWEESEAGKAFKKGEKERQDAEKEAAKAQEDVDAQRSKSKPSASKAKEEEAPKEPTTSKPSTDSTGSKDAKKS